jgi:VWFA-related protein
MPIFLHRAVIVGLMSLAALAQQEPREPIDVGESEEVEVRLVLLDAIVTDAKGRTVPDLTIDDFEILIGGRRVPPDTLDVGCPGGTMGAPPAVKRPRQRGAPPAHDAPRSIVLAFDYPHLGFLDRATVLESAREMVQYGGATNEQIMVVTLTGGLRVEQPFTQNRDEVVEVLRDMEYDVTLYGQGFPHVNDLGFFDGLEALMTLMERVPGPKGMVLYSNIPGSAQEYDWHYQKIAALAAASRTVIYPVWATGMSIPRFG